MKPGQPGSGIAGIGEDAAEGLVVDDGGQEVGDQHPLVVPPDLLTDRLEADVLAQMLGSGQLIGDPVVESQEDGVKLRHDAVLVVARIADERPAAGPAGIWRASGSKGFPDIGSPRSMRIPRLAYM